MVNDLTANDRLRSLTFEAKFCFFIFVLGAYFCFFVFVVVCFAQRCPDLIHLMEDDETKHTFFALPVEDVLLRWFNHHLRC